MRRFCLVIAGGLLLWQATAVASEEKVAPPLRPCDPLEVINILVGPNTFAYKDKVTVPVPAIERDCPFKVITEWTNTGPGQSITLSDFKAVYAISGSPDKWDKVETRTLQQGGVNVPGGNAQFTAASPTGTFTLEAPAGPAGPPRIILFTVTLVTKNNTTVTFDPPWSEKR